MIRRNRRPNWRLIKSLRTYTIDEAAARLAVHRNAVRYWIKQGLPVLSHQRPYLIHGVALVVFLKSRRAAMRRKCKPGELFCLKCREPRAPAAGTADYEQGSSVRGSIIGLCPVCEKLMRRFVSVCRLAAIAPEFGLKLGPAGESLVGTDSPCLSCHSHSEIAP